MRKQLFYLTNHELTAFSWQMNQLSLPVHFENNEIGWERFASWLDGGESTPAYLLIDLIEEDFQGETVPHVSGKAKRALLDRRLAQLYRETPFRHAEAQGRDTEGRKDDRYLMSALTNVELIKPWLRAMLNKAVPLVGIYSLAILGQALFGSFDLGTGPVLLVSHQSSGLRQSYFYEGFLRFSRLTPLPDHATDLIAKSFIAETEKTRQFLASTRLLPRGDQMQIVMLDNVENLTVLQEYLVDTTEVSYLLLEIEQARQLAQLKPLEPANDCSALYVAFLAKSRIASHYPLRDHKHFYQLLQTRVLLYALSAIVALTAAVWTLFDVSTIFNLRQQAAQFGQDAILTERRYQTIVKNMPHTPVAPHNMKSVVDLERMISQNTSSPAVQLAILSKVLDTLPEIKITQIHWQAIETASLAIPADPNSPPPPQVDVPPTAAILGIPDETSQIVLIEGQIQPFKDDYRAAIDSVDKLAANLNKTPHLHADVIQPPLDTRPSVKLENSAGEEQTESKALFTMKLTWKP